MWSSLDGITALLACQIIAGNAFANSYLSLDKAGQQQEYYFIVQGSVLYPIVPSFQDWEFLHGRIPDWWPSTNADLITTLTCGITNAGYAVEEAYLVPKEEKRWYQENVMRTYGTGDINNQGNLLPMRKDLHYYPFNARWFIIIPKVPTCHNTLVESLHFKSRAYLFARFAWAILFRANLFVIAGQDRQIIQVSRDKSSNVEYKTKYCTGEDLENAYGGGGSKTATPLHPRKNRSGQGSAKESEDSFTESSGDSDTNMDDMDWRERGRHRRQESSEETAPDIIPRQKSSEETAPNTKVHLEPALEVELRTALRQIIPQQGVASED
ncbi:hypothetical protein B0T26DRAFT_742347 [Lasiosphaeria miniovina]|uniref:HNH nuclease domain-containing protein n=1 Tax=Lasiosphaeria miniovina TaxID=1954250 RepID=A0AA40ADE2_9PEZI|nr:uncharacterized protein B0T26DRAFT_742347 [Lasiosphaeria miniovina]KAK0713847.1 hypothetical protein B0T26DRAFT_742347 [Lasiosphaeria miniovina]